VLTFNLSHTETIHYSGAVRAALKTNAARRAYVAGKRFFQVVGADGRILDVGEVSL
jgi:hypothetical protein